MAHAATPSDLRGRGMQRSKGHDRTLDADRLDRLGSVAGSCVLVRPWWQFSPGRRGLANDFLPAGDLPRSHSVPRGGPNPRIGLCPTQLCNRRSSIAPYEHFRADRTRSAVKRGMIGRRGQLRWPLTPRRCAHGSEINALTRSWARPQVWKSAAVVDRHPPGWRAPWGRN
jgi:hypothetical protein